MASQNPSSAHSHIEKLKGNNFNTWRFHIGILLKSRGIYGHIDGSTVRGEKPGEQSKWDMNDHKAQNFIVATIFDCCCIILGVLPNSFADLKRHNGILHQTFKAACLSRGLLEDDRNWEITLEEAVISNSPTKLRELFAIM